MSREFKRSGAVVWFLLAAVSACSDDGRDFDRRKISLCWEDQGKKSLEPSTARLIASVCEKFEREFVEKYHTKP